MQDSTKPSPPATATSGDSAGSLRATGISVRTRGPTSPPTFRVTGAPAVLILVAFFGSIVALIVRLFIVRRHAKRARMRVAESESRYRLLFDHIPSPVCVVDGDSLAILEVNEAAISQYRYSRDELERMALTDLAAPGELARHRRKDGTLIDIETSARSIPFAGRHAQLVVITDVTEHRSLEEQLRQSQKMEAVGRLAGGIAHDFNNILTVISSYSQMLRADLRAMPHRTEHMEQIDEILAASSRAGALTRQLLAFGRKQIVRLRPIDPNDTLQLLEPMLRRLVPENIDFNTVLRSHDGSVRADPTQIEQIALNLVINAIDAMPDGGTLVVETQIVQLDELYAHAHSDVEPGHYLMLAVTDTGVGMTEGTIAKAFEPFFTTKELGRGSGLGLATVYGIVTQLGGHVRVYSEPRHGAAFKIYLPCDLSLTAERQFDSSQPPLVVGTGTVLLVEDEDAVRRAVHRMLERLGYSVIDADNGEAGLTAARRARSRGGIDVVVTDLMMPGLDGRTFVDALQLIEPRVRVVYISGYTDDVVVRRGLIDPSHTFLQKPFTLEQLGAALGSARGSEQNLPLFDRRPRHTPT